MFVLGLGAAAGAVYLVTRKEEPKPAPKALGPAPLDASLTPQEAAAVRTALAVETQAKNLLAFADSMDPSHPLSAQALRARAASLGAPITGGTCCASCMSHGPCEGT